MIFSLRTKKERLTTVTVLALLVAGWFIYDYIASGSRKKPAIPVQSEIAVKRDVPQVITVSGFVTPQNSVDIRPQVVATVKSIDVKEGQMVEAGTLLLTLDDRNADANAKKLAAQMAKNEAILEDARRALKRNQELRAQGYISQSMVDSSQSAVDAALAAVNADRAGLASGRITVDYYHLTAPLSGRIGEINVHLGSLVQPGAAEPITTIVQIDPIEITFNVPEQYAQQLLNAEHSKTAPVTAQLDKQKIDGHLSFVNNTIDSATGNLKAKALFENKENLLWPGALVKINLTLQTFKNVVTISPRSIQVGPEGQFVYVIADDGTISAQTITTEYLTSDTAVVSGLTAGLHIVMEGGQDLRPGMSVTVVNTNDKKTTKPNLRD